MHPNSCAPYRVDEGSFVTDPIDFSPTSSVTVELLVCRKQKSFRNWCDVRAASWSREPWSFYAQHALSSCLGYCTAQVGLTRKKGLVSGSSHGSRQRHSLVPTECALPEEQERTGSNDSLETLTYISWSRRQQNDEIPPCTLFLTGQWRIPRP